MTPEEQKQFDQAMRDYDEYRRERAIRALFERDTRGLDVKDFTMFIYGFCWIKTLICLLLRRTRGSYLDDDNMVNILAYDESNYPDGSSWEAVFVSTKLFSGWQVCISTDGT